MIEEVLKNGIINWYTFNSNSKILRVENENEIPITDDKYDYVIALNSPDYLNKLLDKVSADGTLLLGFENSLGFKYFCGDKKKTEFKYFSKDEIINLLKKAGISSFKFYSVLPSLEAAQFVFSHNFSPVEDLSIRYLPLYNNPDSVFDFEEQKYNDLIKNGLFHSMANSFLVECKLQGEFNDALQVTLSSDRGEEKAYATIIRANNKVEKKILFPEGKKSLVELKNNLDELEKIGIKTVENKLTEDSLLMPFVHAPLGNVYLQDLAATDKDKFIQAMDCFRDLIYKSAETGKCYFDFVPLNSFFIDGEFVFFDQEFALDLETYTPEMLLYRTLVIVYSEFEKVNSAVPIDFFWDRYNLRDKIQKCEDVAHSFLMTLRKQDELKNFNALHQRNNALVQFNKSKRNSENFFEPLFEKECFESIADKKIYVFGSGRFADKFLALYKNDYKICGVVDNDSEKWGQDFRGFAVQNPSVLQNLPSDSCVLICVKDYKSIYLQLKSLNVQNVYLYEAHKIYRGRTTLDIPHQKKYHIGYLSGVFDLYHIGHVNMFRRAKEQCDYLIVGVTSDEYVTNKKKRTPFIPFEERLSVVASCKYVDEAVEVPYLYEGIVEAFEKYHYDVQFCGNDYEHNDWWLGQKAWLEQHGSTIVFFPYTQQTSSTKIKALIEKELEEKKLPQPELESPQPEQTVVQAPEVIPGENIPEKKYKKGFALSSLAHANEESATQMRAFAEQCECFVLGIPSDYVMSRIFGGGMNGYNSESVAAWWKSLGFVSDVLILDKLELGYQAVYERLHFDACFYGSEYGSQFENDSRFFAEKGVNFVSAIPSRRIIHGDGDGLKLALQNARKDQKIILFGTGNYFDIFMQNYSMVHPVAYAIDNDAGKWNKKKNGVHIQSPESLKKENPSDVLVVICAKNYREMKQQLSDLGNYNSRTLVYSNEQTLLEEYYISCCKEEAYIKQAQSGLMLLLKEFDRVCKKYNLKYFIICGSLIGVIRHKGFIPWDDDMDLAMTWEDYLKLKKVAKKEWKNSKFHILHYNGLGNGAFLDFMPRLVYMDEYFPTKVYDKVSGKCNPKFEHRMFLDIYPMLNASKNNKKHIFYMNFMKGVYNLCMGHRAFVNYEDYARMPENTVRLMKFINTCGKFLPGRFLTWWYMMLANYAKHEKCDEYFMPSCAITCIERKFKKEWFGNGTYLPFGDMEVMVPEKYGELLEGMGYHGYMNFPPLHIRKPSHYFNSDIEIW